MPTNAANTDTPLRALFAGLSARRAPGSLYHYTSAAGIIGIVETRSFWATNVRFLNDAKEFELALELLDDLLKDKLTEASSRYDRALYEILKDSLSKASSSEVFVASFSEDGDQLGQWRAYCPAGAGYAIGVAPAVLRSARGASDRLLLVRCLYSEREQRILLERLIGLSENYIASQGLPRSSNPDRVYREAFKLFTNWLPTIASVIKHGAFREEREWRLVAPASFFDEQASALRPGRSMLVPYRHFVLSDLDIPLRLTSIIVGPTPHPALAVQGIEALCTSHGLRNVEALLSSIPYRTW